jgi:hypothetical protein
LPEPFDGAVSDVCEIDRSAWRAGTAGGSGGVGGWMGAADTGSDGPESLVWVWVSVVGVKGSAGSGAGVVGRGWEGRPEKVASPRRRLWKGIQGLRGLEAPFVVELSIDLICGGCFFLFSRRSSFLGWGGEGK